MQSTSINDPESVRIPTGTHPKLLCLICAVKINIAHTLYICHLNRSEDRDSIRPCEFRSHRTIIIALRLVVLAVVRRAGTCAAVSLNDKGVAVNDLYSRSISST
jgi:hypothetical protein